MSIRCDLSMVAIVTTSATGTTAATTSTTATTLARSSRASQAMPARWVDGSGASEHTGGSSQSRVGTQQDVWSTCPAAQQLIEQTLQTQLGEREPTMPAWSMPKPSLAVPKAAIFGTFEMASILQT